MKILFVAFLALALSANALPQEYELENSGQRNIADVIRTVIEVISRWLRDNNLDPLQINRLVIDTEPMPGVDIFLIIERLEFTGISNIAIHRLEYNPYANRLIMDVSLPKLSFSLVNSAMSLTINRNRYTGEFRGECAITAMRFTLDIRVSGNIITGLVIRSVDATARVQDVWSKFTLVILNRDLSPALNRLVNDRIPKFLDDYRDQIDRVISVMIKEVGNWILKPRSIV